VIGPVDTQALRGALAHAYSRERRGRFRSWGGTPWRSVCSPAGEAPPSARSDQAVGFGVARGWCFRLGPPATARYGWRPGRRSPRSRRAPAVRPGAAVARRGRGGPVEPPAVRGATIGPWSRSSAWSRRRSPRRSRTS
jgi:hypothetical protein